MCKTICSFKNFQIHVDRGATAEQLLHKGFAFLFLTNPDFFTALISLLVLNFQLILFFPSAVKFYPGLLQHCVFEPGNYFQLLGKRFLRVFIYLQGHCFDLSDYVSINAGSTCLSLLYLIKRLINRSSVL